MQSVLSKKLSIMEFRGHFLQSKYSMPVLITAHPSPILRVPDENDRHKAFQQLVKDLTNINQILMKDK